MQFFFCSVRFAEVLADHKAFVFYVKVCVLSKCRADFILSSKVYPITVKCRMLLPRSVYCS
jgi:hypothetical protein